VIWPSAYDWPDARRWSKASPLASRPMSASTSRTCQHYRHVVLFQLQLYGDRHDVAIDYADRSELNDDSLRRCSLYFKMQSGRGIRRRVGRPGRISAELTEPVRLPWSAAPDPAAAEVLGRCVRQVQLVAFRGDARLGG
jgi:hypothetical protein